MQMTRESSGFKPRLDYLLKQMDVDYYAIQFALIFSGARPAFLIQDTEYRRDYADLMKNMKEVMERAIGLVRKKKYSSIHSRVVKMDELVEVYFSSSDLKQFSDEQLFDDTIRASLLALTGTYNDETRRGKFFSYSIMSGKHELLTYICPEKEEGMCDYHADFLVKEFNDKVRVRFQFRKTTDLGKKFLETSILEGRFEGMEQILNQIWNSGYLPSENYFDDLNEYKKGVLTALWFTQKYDVDLDLYSRLKPEDRDFVDRQKKLTCEIIRTSEGTSFKDGMHTALYTIYKNYPYRVRSLNGELGLSEAEYKTLLKDMFRKITASF